MTLGTHTNTNTAVYTETRTGYCRKAGGVLSVKTLVEEHSVCAGITAHGEGGGKVQFYPFMTTALEGVRVQGHASASLYPRITLGSHCTLGWVDIMAVLNRCGKSHPSVSPLFRQA